MKLVIIDYGAGNIQSIQFAFKRLGVDAVLSNSVEEIKGADSVIFPGVGQAKSAMEKLEESRLNNLIPELQQPVLGICLGMQLLCASTEEGETKGLGIFDTQVKRFDFNTNELKVPQIGWNTINELKTNLFEGINEEDYVYSVHSYYAEKCNHTIATSNYGENYSAALQKDNFYGVQFHPEKSGSIGEQILNNFLEIKIK